MRTWTGDLRSLENFFNCTSKFVVFGSFLRIRGFRTCCCITCMCIFFRFFKCGEKYDWRSWLKWIFCLVFFLFESSIPKTRTTNLAEWNLKSVMVFCSLQLLSLNILPLQHFISVIDGSYSSTFDKSHRSTRRRLHSFPCESEDS